MSKVATSLISHCSTRGIRLWVEGNRLEVAAKPGVMNRRDLANLKIHKAEVVRALAPPIPAGPPDPPALPGPPTHPFDPVGFLDELFAHKIAVWADGPSLKHYDHDGAITDADRAVLATQEEGIIAYLTTGPTPEESAAVEAEVRRVWVEDDAAKGAKGDAAKGDVIDPEFGIVESADYPVDRFVGLSPGRPLPWRSAMARWPVDAKERWGRRANELQGEGNGSGGLDWREAERVAFEEVNGGPVPSWVADHQAASVDSTRPVLPAWVDDPSLTFGLDDVKRIKEAPPARAKRCSSPGCSSTERTITKGTGPHAAKEVCGGCGAFVRWLGKAEAEGLGFRISDGIEDKGSQITGASKVLRDSGTPLLDGGRAGA